MDILLLIVAFIMGFLVGTFLIILLSNRKKEEPTEEYFYKEIREFFSEN